MNNQHRMRLTKIAFCVALAVGAAPAIAQNTTSAVGGRITATDGKAVSGAVVRILHVESGSVTNTTTDAEGRYSARGLRVGGPFTITITKDGVTEKRENVFLILAETATVDAKLGAARAGEVEKIVVTSTAVSDAFSRTAMGAGTNVGRDQLESLASIGRSLQDYARIDPRLSQTDKERGQISAGGQNTRFNSITVDGVSISDTFGLAANGLPTAKQPISIDAIQSVQVNISNYDVTQKGYTGANINAVTKSGTNELKGSIYFVTRDDKLAGDRVNRTTGTFSPPPPFEQTTKGLTIGGPIIKDKLFFFASYEEFKSSITSPDFGPLGSSLTNVGITPSAIASAQAIATSRYNINIGASDVPSGLETDVKDALIKLDWNINDSHRVNFRYNKTEEKTPVFAGFGVRSLSLNSHWWVQGNTIETNVAQWFADWTSNFSTELKLSQRDFDSIPKNGSTLPQVALNFTGALPVGTPTSVPTGTRTLLFGTERSRQFNVLQTKTFDAYFAGNLFLKAHEIKFGADVNENKVFNAFLQDVNGNYSFGCQNSTPTYTYSFGAINCATATAAQIEAAVLENFSIGRPSVYRAQLPVTGGTLAAAAANFKLQNLGTFIQDTWTVNPNLTVTYGVRLDMQKTNDKPTFNAAVAAPLIAGSGTTNQTGGFGRDNSQTVDGKNLVQPRIGFNYTFDSARPMQLRGGFGLFQGAAPVVWLANPYSNTGVTTRIITCTNAATCPPTGGTFNPNPAAQPASIVGTPPAAGVDILDPALGQPAVWKANIAFEHQLPFMGLTASAEYIYTKTKTAFYYQQLNLGAPTRTGPDGRELYRSAAGYNPACWTAVGVAIVSTVAGSACFNNVSRALRNLSFDNVTLATKTSGGDGNQLTLAISQPMTKGFSWSLAYTYTMAKEVSPLTSSVATSSFNSRAIFNPNEDVTATSAYINRDRVSGTLQWQRAFFGKYRTRVGLFMEGRTGRPYSWTFTNDVNGDNVAGNDLLYIPRAPGSGEVVFLGDTATSRTNEDAFWAIVNANPELRDNTGGVVKRASGFSPWTNSLDMRISQELPGFMKKHKSSVTLDIANLGNLLNNRWGRIDEIDFRPLGGQRRSFVNYAGIDAQGRYIYAVGSAANDFITRNNRGESQWSAQVTYRYEF